MAKPSDFRDRSFKQSAFMKIGQEIARKSGSGNPPIALHVGDTWFDIPEELKIPLNEEPWNDRLSRYGDTQGEIELRKRLFHKVKDTNRLPIKSEEEIQITFGATGALFLCMNRLLEKGDEVLVLSPYWTIFKVVASAAGARVVEVPFFDKVSNDIDNTNVADWLEPFVTNKTAAIYYNNPNNPSGVMLNPEQIKQIADFAVKHDLWVFSDEAYEDFIWSDIEYLSIGSLPDMYERTMSIFSFSKSFAAAGIRLGYIAGPKGAIATINPGHVGVGYEPNRPSQVQGIRGLERQGLIVPVVQNSYREGWQAATENMKVPYLRPDGSFYLFLDLRDKWDGLSEDAMLKSMFDAGVVMSPGAVFGADYKGWARFCYTAEKPEVIAEAAKRISKI